MSTEKSIISRRIAQCRHKKGLTQAELAFKLGISSVTLTQYECDSREPTGKILAKMEKIFGVSGAFLYGLTDNPVSFTGAEPVTVTTLLDGQKIYEATKPQEPDVSKVKAEPKSQQIPKEKVEAMIKDATWATEQNTRRLSSNRIQRLTDRIDIQFNIIVLEAVLIALLVICLAGLCWSSPHAGTRPLSDTETTVYHITQPALAAEKSVETVTTEKLQPAPDYAVPLPENHKAAVLAACAEYGVDPLVAFAVMQTESCYQADAENAVCVGYYQINTEYAWYYKEQLGVAGIQDPLDNIQCGIWYLGQLISRCDSLDLALMHYNLGNIADDYWEAGITSTVYAQKVRSAMCELAEGAEV